MKQLYLLLNIASIAIPFLFSFERRISFYKKWPWLFLAILITTIPFIIWDIIFTNIGVWGFNENYLIGIQLFGLPIEEWLFFLCIPYACIFMHYSLTYLFSNWVLSKKLVKMISIFLIFIFLLVSIIYSDRWYTLVNYGYATLILLIAYFTSISLLQRFYITFLVMLIPFFLVNGVLTGFGITHEIVWYNDAENLGVRMITIPIEDMTYAFSLILSSLMLMNFLPKLLKKKARTSYNYNSES